MLNQHLMGLQRRVCEIELAIGHQNGGMDQAQMEEWITLKLKQTAQS